jgi:hypothetical protein
LEVVESCNNQPRERERERESKRERERERKREREKERERRRREVAHLAAAANYYEMVVAARGKEGRKKADLFVCGTATMTLDVR